MDVQEVNKANCTSKYHGLPCTYGAGSPNAMTCYCNNHRSLTLTAKCHVAGLGRSYPVVLQQEQTLSSSSENLMAQSQRHRARNQYT
eukprot:809170-Amphidinium_carterae.1